MNEAGTEKNITLTDEIVRLDNISWRMDTQLFGEKPVKEPAPTTLAGDRITEARNKIANIADRLEQMAKRLETI